MELQRQAARRPSGAQYAAGSPRAARQAGGALGGLAPWSGCTRSCAELRWDPQRLPKASAPRAWRAAPADGSARPPISSGAAWQVCHTVLESRSGVSLFDGGTPRLTSDLFEKGELFRIAYQPRRAEKKRTRRPRLPPGGEGGGTQRVGSVPFGGREGRGRGGHVTPVMHGTNGSRWVSAHESSSEPTVHDITKRGSRPQPARMAGRGPVARARLLPARRRAVQVVGRRWTAVRCQCDDAQRLYKYFFHPRATNPPAAGRAKVRTQRAKRYEF